MSLYGAMMIGVSALDAFSNALSTTSSNIANVNTVGYKTGATTFSTLLAGAMGEGDMSQAGVITGTDQNIGQQGLLQTASSPTDLAISGNGFFMVNSKSDMSGGDYYTRAGDFSPDANGNLSNSAGFYLMGYACGPDGSVAPGAALSAVNVTNLTGKAEPTQNMTIQANLQSSTDINTDYDLDTGSMMFGSGGITPDFTRTINIYDSQGGSKPITVSYLKTGDNTWAYEVSYAGTPTDVGQNGALPQGLLSAGTMVFNTDGTLKSITPDSEDTKSTVSPDGGSLSIPMNWTTGVAAQTVSINFGTPGSSNGMSQFDSADTLTNSTVDGALFGTLSGVSVGADGIVTAQFSNGLTQKIFEIPLATFTNENGLGAVNGNAYAETANSGGPVIGGAGEGNAGQIQGSALEGSTVDLATEFTNLITTQRAYTASTRVITTASDMLQTLEQMQ
ncbi:MAG TPA: flagellar hook protein FlgE [Rhizomicrobium sp.]|jgi:flagellar hook protein FlgE